MRPISGEDDDTSDVMRVTKFFSVMSENSYTTQNDKSIYGATAIFEEKLKI